MSPTPARRRVAALPSIVAASRAAAALFADARPGYVGALVDAGLMSAAGMQVLVVRRLEMLRDTLGELGTVGRVMRHAGVRESLRHADGLVRGAVELAVSHLQELAVLAAATQREALAILNRRRNKDVIAVRQRRSLPATSPRRSRSRPA